MVMMSMHVEPALRLFCDSALIIALLANWHGEFIWDIMTFSSTCFLIGKMPWTAEEDNRFYLLWPTSPKKSYLLYRQIPNCPGIRPWKKNLNATLRLHAHDQLQIYVLLAFFTDF